MNILSRCNLFSVSTFTLYLLYTSVIADNKHENFGNNACSEHSEDEFIVNLNEFRNLEGQSRVLGMHLSSNSLQVKSFERNKETGELPWIHTVAGVKKGDLLVAIDGKYIQTHKVYYIAPQIKSAETLTFHRNRNHDGNPKSNHCSIQGNKFQAYHENNGNKKAQSVMHIIRDQRKIFSVAMEFAAFSSKSTLLECALRPLSFVDTQNNCVLNEHMDYSNVRNSYLVSQRGGCSFAKIGLNAQQLRASGNIIINNKDQIFEMPTDPQYLEEFLTIPSLMISQASGERIFKVLEHSKDLTLFGMLDSNSNCSSSDTSIINTTSGRQFLIDDMKITARQKIVHKCTNGQCGKENPIASQFEIQNKLSTKSISDHYHYNKKIRGGEIVVMGTKHEPIEFVVFDSERAFFPINTPIDVHFVKAEHDCTTLEQHMIENNIFDGIVSIVGDSKSKFCSYRKQIMLAQQYGLQTIIMYPNPAHEFPSDIFLSLENMMANKSNIRWIEDNKPNSSYMKKNEYENNDAFVMVDRSIIIMKSNDFNWMNAHAQRMDWRQHSEYSNKHVTVMLTPKNSVHTTWSHLYELSFPLNWPTEARQRKRLLISMEKGNRLSDEGSVALKRYFHDAELYFDSYN